MFVHHKNAEPQPHKKSSKMNGHAIYISEAKAKQGIYLNHCSLFMCVYDTTEIKHNKVILHHCTKNTNVAVGNAKSKSSGESKAVSHAKLKSLILPNKEGGKKEEKNSCTNLLTIYSTDIQLGTFLVSSVKALNTARASAEDDQ